MNETQSTPTTSRTVRGYILGSIAAVSYGSNPLFAVPLYESGLSTSSVLLYRYFFATVLMGLLILCTGQSFRLRFRELPFMIGQGIIFALSSLFLFESYNYLDVGIATTLLFLTPVFVTLIMWLGFGLRLSVITVAALVMSVVGIILLYKPGGGQAAVTGIVLVILSALSYAVYMVAINKSRLKALPGMTLTFYSLAFGMIVFVIKLNFLRDLQPVPPTLLDWSCIAGISIVPTIISLVAIAWSVRDVGSVVVSLLGALEPVTGIAIGALVFGETLTVANIAGIVLILLSVALIVLSRPIVMRFKAVMSRVRE